MKNIAILLMLTFIQFVHADVLIVSDIDDTIKRTNVHASTIPKYWNAMQKRNSFFGMSELYNCLLYTSPSPRD